MKTNYKVGDKVTILPFEVGTVGRRVYYPEMLPNIGLSGIVQDVTRSGVEVMTSKDTWYYDFKFIKPYTEETTMSKAINVINQSEKVRTKLSTALVSLGYELDCDYGAGSHGNDTRIYNDYRNHDVGSVSGRSSISTVDADGLKFKAVLKAVIPLLEFSTERPQVGDKVVVLSNPERLDGVYVGIIGTVSRDDRSTSLPLQITFPDNKWWFSPDSVRVLKAATKSETSDVKPVVADTPKFEPKFKVGDRVKVVAHDGTHIPLDTTCTVTAAEEAGYTGSLPYEVSSESTSDWVGHTALELLPVESKALNIEDFKFTRVKLKATGAEGVVIGRGSITTSVCVQFDKPSSSLHSAGRMHYQGAENRCGFHGVSELEIIGE